MHIMSNITTHDRDPDDEVVTSSDKVAVSADDVGGIAIMQMSQPNIRSIVHHRIDSCLLGIE
jgi:hypothetical protein